MATPPKSVRNLFGTFPTTLDVNQESTNSHYQVVQKLINELLSLSRTDNTSNEKCKEQIGGLQVSAQIIYDGCVRQGKIESAQKIYAAVIGAGLSIRK